MRSIFGLRHKDSGALLDPSDPADKESPRLKLGLERGSLLGRQRDEQAARRLRIKTERDDRLWRAVERHVLRGEVAVSRVAARAHILARKIERAVDRRQTLPLEHEPHAAAVRDLVRVAEQT